MKSEERRRLLEGVSDTLSSVPSSKRNSQSDSKQLQPMLGVALATALLLLVPAVAMQFTSEVSWGAGDFILAGALLFGAGAAAVMGFSCVKGTARRAALVFAIACGLALVWAELAVGLFH